MGYDVTIERIDVKSNKKNMKSIVDLIKKRKTFGKTLKKGIEKKKESKSDNRKKVIKLLK